MRDPDQLGAAWATMPAEGVVEFFVSHTSIATFDARCPSPRVVAELAQGKAAFLDHGTSVEVFVRVECAFSADCWSEIMIRDGPLGLGGRVRGDGSRGGGAVDEVRGGGGGDGCRGQVGRVIEASRGASSTECSVPLSVFLFILFLQVIE